MKQKIGALLFLFTCCMPLVGFSSCRKAVKIEQPVKGGSHTAVSEFKVKLHPNLDPSTFAAKLDGMPHFHPFENITPGEIAIAPAVEFGPGKHTLEVFGRISPSEPGDTLNDIVEFTPPPLELSEPAWSASPNSLQATCPAGSTCYVLPNRPLVSQTPIAQGATHTVTIFVPSAPATPVSVYIFTPNSNLVSLNDESAGTGITVVIPTNDRRQTFTVRGIERGRFSLKAKAIGYQTDEISWSVQ